MFLACFVSAIRAFAAVIAGGGPVPAIIQVYSLIFELQYETGLHHVGPPHGWLIVLGRRAVVGTGYSERLASLGLSVSNSTRAVSGNQPSTSTAASTGPIATTVNAGP